MLDCVVLSYKLSSKTIFKDWSISCTLADDNFPRIFINLWRWSMGRVCRQSATDFLDRPLSGEGWISTLVWEHYQFVKIMCIYSTVIPAKAGIQNRQLGMTMEKQFYVYICNSSIIRGKCPCIQTYWIPAFAGMTGTYPILSFPRRRESISYYP